MERPDLGLLGLRPKHSARKPCASSSNTVGPSISCRSRPPIPFHRTSLGPSSQRLPPWPSLATSTAWHARPWLSAALHTAPPVRGISEIPRSFERLITLESPLLLLLKHGCVQAGRQHITVPQRDYGPPQLEKNQVQLCPLELQSD